MSAASPNFPDSSAPPITAGKPSGTAYATPKRRYRRRSPLTESAELEQQNALDSFLASRRAQEAVAQADEQEAAAVHEAQEATSAQEAEAAREAQQAEAVREAQQAESARKAQQATLAELAAADAAYLRPTDREHSLWRQSMLCSIRRARAVHKRRQPRAVHKRRQQATTPPTVCVTTPHDHRMTTV